MNAPDAETSRFARYAQFALLVLAAGALFPIMYLRQNFEVSLIEALHITASDLGDLNFILGAVVAVSYIPSGILADMVQPRLLMSFSLLVVGALGFWMSTYPSLLSLKIIFFGWGIAGGLCFWASMLKAVKLMAASSEQGRFFGILDGGRGLVEAILASIAILMFREMSTPQDAATLRMTPVILLYSSTAMLLGALVFFVVKDNPAAVISKAEREARSKTGSTFLKDVGLLLRMPQIWLVAGVITIGQGLFFLTYSVSAYLQVNLGLTALAAGSITLSKLWMRPVGGFTIGFLGDWLSREVVMAWLMLFAAFSLLSIIFLPLGGHIYLILPLVLVIGYITYAIKGLYWSLLDYCPVPPHLTGLAIGLVSFLGYMPDTVLPLYDGFLARNHDRAHSLNIYFITIACTGFVGAVLCVWLRRMNLRAAAAVAGAQG
jgi:sugar phosphate permease